MIKQWETIAATSEVVKIIKTWITLPHLRKESTKINGHAGEQANM